MSSRSSTSFLSLQDLAVGHSDRTVLRCPQLDLERGEVVALMGASGTGKTTLFTAIAGQTDVQEGKIRHQGAIVEKSWLRRHVARTLPNFPLFHWLTVAKNLELVAKLRRLPCPPAEEIFAQVAAEHLVNRWPHTLSSGERCRASLGMCLVTRPEVLLLDEPFNGLDILTKQEVANAVIGFVERQKCAAILITHDFEDALEFAKRIAVVRSGQPSTITAIFETANHTGLRDTVISHLT